MNFLVSHIFVKQLILIVWPCHTARGILFPRPGIESMSPAEWKSTWSPDHWMAGILNHILKTVYFSCLEGSWRLCKAESPCTKTKIPLPILQGHWEKFTSLLVSHRILFFFQSQLKAGHLNQYVFFWKPRLIFISPAIQGC